MPLEINPTTTVVPTKKRGCFFYGCMTVIVATIVIIVGIFLGFRYVTTKFVDTYTQTTPLALPALDSSTESYLRVKGKVEAFRNDLREGKTSALELSAGEINTFLSSQPGLEGLTDKFRVAIEGSELRGVLSVSLDEVGYSDRYLNGLLSLKVQMADGKLDLRVNELEVGGKALPEQIVAQLIGENLFDKMEASDRENILQTLKGVKSIVIESGMVKMKGGA